jgi:hypothetical protein
MSDTLVLLEQYNSLYLRNCFRIKGLGGKVMMYIVNNYIKYRDDIIRRASKGSSCCECPARGKCRFARGENVENKENECQSAWQKWAYTVE